MIRSRMAFALAALVGAIAFAPIAQAQDAVDTAATYSGVPYLLGGDSRSGIDCSALTRRAFRELQRELPRTSADQYNITKNSRISRANLLRNDLVFFWTVKGVGVVAHVGIYIGNGQFINANSEANAVKIDNIDSTYWKPRFMGGGRIAPDLVSGAQVLLRPWEGNNPRWRYFMAYNGGGQTVATNSSNPWAWETWRIQVNGGGPVRNGSVVFLQASNGQYLSSNGSWTLATADRNGVAGWELFKVVRENGDGVVRSGERVALQGWQGQFLGANYNYGDWKAGCWFAWGGWGNWETITVVVK